MARPRWCQRVARAVGTPQQEQAWITARLAAHVQYARSAAAAAARGTCAGRARPARPLRTHAASPAPKDHADHVQCLQWQVRRSNCRGCGFHDHGGGPAAGAGFAACNFTCVVGHHWWQWHRLCRRLRPAVRVCGGWWTTGGPRSVGGGWCVNGCRAPYTQGGRGSCASAGRGGVRLRWSQRQVPPFSLLRQARVGGGCGCVVFDLGKGSMDGSWQTEGLGGKSRRVVCVYR